jgi:hypothetical protein
MTAPRRLPSSKIGFGAELEQALPAKSLHEPDPVFAPERDQIAPARPRAPPA